MTSDHALARGVRHGAAATGLAAVAICWPLLLGLTVALRHDGRAPVATTAVYMMASLICHQRPERSFATDGVQWPLCARCSGLYLAAPVGGLAAFAAWRRRVRLHRVRTWLVVACAPTVGTLILEWGGLAHVTNLARALAALPAGAAIAFAIVTAAAGMAATDQVN